MKMNHLLKYFSAAVVSAVILFSCNILTGCEAEEWTFSEAHNGPSLEDYGEQEKHTVIIDTDTAADDAMSIALCAKAPNLDILGVTVLAGNVDIDQAADNALMTLEVAGAADVPVYKGAVKRYSGAEMEVFSVFGESGMGNVSRINPKKKCEKKAAVDFILETVAASPGKIEILATGPLTNIAKAIDKDPETMSKVKRIWSMGTAGLGMEGNASPVAEFNVYLDAEAYKRVAESGIPMTVVGLDMCLEEDVRITDDRLSEMSECCESGKFIANSIKGIMDYYRKENCLSTVDICDPVAASALIWDDFIVDSKKCQASVITEDKECRGAVLFYKKGSAYNIRNVDEGEFNVVVVTEIDSESYFDRVKALIRD